MIPEVPPYNNYSGDGLTTQFDFDFYIEDGSQLKVELINENGITNTLQENIDYSINEIGNENGSYILFPKAGSKYPVLSNAEIISLQLTLPVSQESEYGKSSELDFKSIENSFDYLTRLVQILKRGLERAVKVQEGSEATSDELLDVINTKVITAEQAASKATGEAVSAHNSAVNAEEQALIATQKTAEVQEIYENAAADIANKHSNAVLEIQHELSISEDTIIADKAEALEKIAYSKTDAVNACEYEVTKAKQYAEESGGKGMPTDICKRLNIEYDTENRKVKLKWKDPADTINSLGQIMSSWAGTILTCKENLYPVNYDDGTILINNTKRNQYENTDFEYSVPENITDITTLKFRVFPYSANDVYNKDNRNCFDKAIVYELLLEDNNSSPYGCLSYPEGSMNENYKPAFMDYANQVFNYGSWKDAFFMDLFKPCMLKSDGTVDYYLCPDDYTKKADGVTPSDVANTSYDGNAMIEIGQFWIKTRKENGKIHTYIANKQIDEDYHCWTHYNKNGTLLPYIYRALYNGSNINNKIRSISGQAPCVNLAGNTQIAYAQANGEGHDIDEYSLRDALNWLLLLIGKSTDTQTVFGTGRHSGGSAQNYNQVASGTLDKKGMFWGDNNNGAVKVFGIENWWGNVWQITNGLLQTGNKLYIKLTPNTQDGSTVVGYQQTSVEGYIDTGITLSGTSGGYISKMALVEGKGLLPSVVSGSSSTYFCDGCWWNGGLIGFARFGSAVDTGLLVGACALLLNNLCSLSVWTCGVSLSYKSPL